MASRGVLLCRQRRGTLNLRLHTLGDRQPQGQRRR